MTTSAAFRSVLICSLAWLIVLSLGLSVSLHSSTWIKLGGRNICLNHTSCVTFFKYFFVAYKSYNDHVIGNTTVSSDLLNCIQQRRHQRSKLSILITSPVFSSDLFMSATLNQAEAKEWESTQAMSEQSKVGEKWKMSLYEQWLSRTGLMFLSWSWASEIHDGREREVFCKMMWSSWKWYRWYNGEQISLTGSHIQVWSLGSSTPQE